MGRTFYTCNINKTGLLHLLRHASPRLYNFIIADNPDHSLLYHFLNENEKKLQDLKNDSIKFEDNFITIYNPCKEFVDKCPDINILQLLKLLSNADIFIVLNNLIAKRSEKPHIIQAATILLAVMSLTEYSSEKLEQLNVLLNLCPKNGFQICLKYKEPTDHWINELLMPKQKRGSSVSDDNESYDSDASIPVYHPILTYAELSDDAVEDEQQRSSGSNDEAAEIEETENFETPNLTHVRRSRRTCVKINIKQEISKRVKKVSPNASIPLKRSKIRTVVKASYEHEIHQVLLPQFHYSVTFPNRTAYKRWKNPLSYNNCILPNFLPIDYDAALEKFRSLRNGTEIPHASTLILGDSILASCNFEEKLDSTVSIMITFPYKAEDFTDSFTKKMIDCANDFTFKNIVIAFGTEFILYDPDLKAAVDVARNFIISILNAFNQYFESKPYVRIILLTLPQVNSNPSTIDFSYDFSYFNKQMRKFVHKYRDEIKEKQNIDFCLFDWQKKSSMFKESNVEHVSRRYQILLNHLSKYTSVTDY